MMKSRNTLLTIALLLITSAVALTASGRTMPDTPSSVLNPLTPSSVTFAGEKIDLDDASRYERYDRELTAMAYTHGSTLLCIKRANKYFPIMAPILKRNDIPADLLYLACIESTLDTEAVSPSGAAGLWQFMPSTGRAFGLEVNDNVDERFNIEKATEAACRYLKQAYKIYGDWATVAASYNAGQGRISRELEAQMVDNAMDLHLVSETRRYIFRLLAMKEIMEHSNHYGYHLHPRQLYQPVEYERVMVDTTVTSWPKWAIQHGINYRMLREHNPWIRSRELPNKSRKKYEVLIPTESSRKRSTGIDKVYNPQWTKWNRR